MTRPTDWSPLRASDPVPGDPVAVLALAQRWADTADAVAAAAAGLRAVHTATTVWRSASGRAFQDRTGTCADRVARVQGRYAAGAEVLAAYARALDDAQHDAGRARLSARRAQQELDAAERVLRPAVTARTLAAAATGSPVPPDAEEQRAADRAADARRRLARAEADLQRAEQDWRDAGRRAVAALDGVADDGLDDRFDGALDVVAAAVPWVSRVSAAAGAAALLPPATPAAGPVAAVTGGVAALATGVLWANDRAAGREVAGALFSPVLGAVSRSSVLTTVRDEVVSRVLGRAPTAPPLPPGPPGGRPVGTLADRGTTVTEGRPAGAAAARGSSLRAATRPAARRRSRA